MTTPYLPTFEAVRLALQKKELQLPFNPTRSFSIAALVLQVDGVRREEWTDDVELSPKLFARFPRGIVPSPDDKSLRVATSYKVIDDTKPTRNAKCMNCILKPGSIPCHSCDGKGTILSGEAAIECFGCNGRGSIPCSICDGEQTSVACTIRYVNDRPVTLRQLFVPQVHDSLRPELVGALDAAAYWPEALRFDPSPAFVASAYRGASAVRAEDNFHGHYFGAALDACRAAKEASITGLARADQRFFAIPILWLIHEGHGTGDQHVAYFFDAARELHQVVGRPIPPPF